MKLTIPQLMLPLILMTCAGSPETRAFGQEPTATTLVVNLGPIFLLDYNSQNAQASHPLAQSACPSGKTVRACYQRMLDPNPNSPNHSNPNYSANNYTAQGFRIPSVMISTGEAWNGTCNNPQTCGQVNPTWSANLRTFLSDLKTYGITQISFILIAPGYFETCYAGPSGCSNIVTIASACNGHNLVFYRGVPYGFDATKPAYPDCFSYNPGTNTGNAGYYTSPQSNGQYGKANPYFWGWAPTGNIIGAVVAALPSGMSILNFQLSGGPIDLIDFPIMARWIYDNTGTPPVNVLSFLRSYAGNYASKLRYAAGDARNPDYPFANGSPVCNSVYGGPATAQSLSVLIRAMTGYSFGQPVSFAPWTNPNSPNSDKRDWNYLCATGTGHDLDGLPTLPVSFASNMPTYLRFGAYSDTICRPNSPNRCEGNLCGSGSCGPYAAVQPTTAQFQTVAQSQFDDMWTVTYPKTTVDMCETFPNQVNPTGDGFTMAQAAYTAYGWAYSSLSSWYFSNTPLNVWENAQDPSYVMPNIVNPPYSCTPLGGGSWGYCYH